jgi:hypothetical protein
MCKAVGKYQWEYYCPPDFVIDLCIFVMEGWCCLKTIKVI